MHHFNYKKGELHCEEVQLRKIANEIGTPFYCYSQATITRHAREFIEPFVGTNSLICYAVKANSNLSVLKLLFSLGCGADIVSIGELRMALRAGADPQKIVFSGVGKKREEIAAALKANILLFNVESAQELQLIGQVAKELKITAPVSLRVNPDIDAKTHPYITTGLHENKFGIPMEEAIDLFHRAHEDKNLRVVGIDCHIGSQLTELSPFIQALKSLKEKIKQLRDDGIEIEFLDLGGGLGITYQNEEPPHPREYAKAIIEEIRDLNITLIMEPGRTIVGNAGILVTEVLFTKTTPSKEFVIVDAAMNDLIRPGLYDAYQEILPVKEKPHAKKRVVDVVGPVCETGDFLARNRQLQETTSGELLAVMSAGAYGFSMSSNYNARGRVAEILVSGNQFAVIRARETVEDLVKNEIPPQWSLSP
ncbi:diaminopimelate decarboxylase [Bdellovibrionota bacterium]